MKPQTAYAIKEKDGDIYFSTIRIERRSCINQFLNGSTTIDWKGCYKLGWRCVKVNIIEANK